MRFSVRQADVYAGEEKRTLRKSAFWLRALTEKRILYPVTHGKTHSAIPRSHRLRLSVTLRRPGGVGQPPARLRGTMENASTGQTRSSNPPPACGAGCARVRRSRFEFDLTERRILAPSLTEKHTLSTIDRVICGLSLTERRTLPHPIIKTHSLTALGTAECVFLIAECVFL